MGKHLPRLQGAHLSDGVRSAILCLASAALTAAVMLASPTLNTPGELLMILFWTAPLALSLGLGAAIAPKGIRRIAGVPRYALAVLLGAGAGFLWGIVVFSAFLSPYFGTFSIPVGLVWMVAGVSGFLPVAGADSPHRRRSFLTAITITTLASVAVGLGADTMSKAVNQERTVETVWVRWYPGPQALELEDHLASMLSPAEKERLSEMGITGYLDWRLSSTRERGPLSRMIVIMQRPIALPVDLALPEREPVIYVQQSDGSWIVDPPGAAMLEKTIRLAQDPDRPQATVAFLKVPGGTVIFGGIDWSADPPP